MSTVTPIHRTEESRLGAAKLGDATALDSLRQQYAPAIKAATRARAAFYGCTHEVAAKATDALFYAAVLECKGRSLAGGIRRALRCDLEMTVESTDIVPPRTLERWRAVVAAHDGDLSAAYAACIAGQAGMTPATFRDVQAWQSVASLDAVDPDTGSTLAQTAPMQPLTAASEPRDWGVREMVAGLPERERAVLERLYGFVVVPRVGRATGWRAVTYRAVAADLGITPAEAERAGAEGHRLIRFLLGVQAAA